jgi:hypothetical protein
MRIALPLVRPLALAIALPFAALALVSTLGSTAAPPTQSRMPEPEAFERVPDGRLLVVPDEESESAIEERIRAGQLPGGLTP